MATHAIRPIHPVYSRRDERFESREIAGGVTFEKGTPVDINAAGKYVIATGSPVYGVSLAGTADYDWQNDTFDQVNPRVPAADVNQEFRGTLLGTYAAATDANARYALGTTVVNGKTYYILDKAAAAGTTPPPAQVEILGVDDEVRDGDVNPPVRFIFLDEAKAH